MKKSNDGLPRQARDRHEERERKKPRSHWSRGKLLPPGALGVSNRAEALRRARRESGVDSVIADGGGHGGRNG